ncbi:MAG TPA: hypothetical protein VIM36_01495 [Gemmatimonadaceae bacterium]
MAAGAAERVADIAGQTVPSGEKNRTAPQGGYTISAVAELSVGRNSKRYAPFRSDG